MKNFTNSLELIASALSALSPMLAPSQAFAMGAAPIVVAQADLSADAGGAPLIDSLDMEDAMSDATVVAANTRRTTTTKTTRTTRRTTTTRPATSSARPAPSSSASTAPRRPDANFARANKLAANGQYQEASKLLFQMSRSPNYEKNSAQIKYVLGLMLFEMKLNQSSAFVLYDLVRQETKSNPRSRFIRQSLEKLAIAADALDSDVLLRYAIKQVDENEFPAASRDMLYYRTGEVKMGEKNYAEAARQFSRVRVGSRFFNRARYNMGLALAQANDLEKAQAVFEDLADRLKTRGVTDTQRVSALMGRARVLYQRRLFAGAIEAYRDIPRDTEAWHEGLFESSWAMLQDGRFRSALSNFHSLHSPFYEDYYQPESVLLRAIVYLYICRYQEMSKTIDLFERVYKPIQRDVHTILTTIDDANIYYRELAKVEANFDAIRSNRIGRRGFSLPFAVARQLLKQGDVRHTFNYIQNLEDEKKRMQALPSTWRTSGIGIYSMKIIEKRLEATRILAGRQIRRHMILIDNELRDLFEQSGFLRFEMLNSKREALKKEIQGKGLEKVDQDAERSYYVQNGYEYWPFKGEYWLDEIGNYHYVGVSACE
jgi:outer membrane protein assembly factor BamD (BamD/ComL family)